MRALGIVLLLAASIVARDTAPARACSCEDTSQEERLFGADLLFIGTPVQRESVDARSTDTVVTFRVRALVLGEAGPLVEINATTEESECGSTWWAAPAVEREIVVTAYQLADGLTNTGGCGSAPRISVSDFETLLSGGLPMPTSDRPLAAVVALQARWANLAAVDANGELVAWAVTEPRAWLTTCSTPHLLEVDYRGGHQIRDLATMEVRVESDEPTQAVRGSLLCIGEHDDALGVLAVDGGFERGRPVSLTYYEDGDPIATTDGSLDGRAVAVDPVSRRVFVLPDQPGVITALDLDTLTATPLESAEGNAILAGAVSPDGAHLAVAANGTGDPGLGFVGAVEIHDISGARLDLAVTIPVSPTPVAPTSPASDLVESRRVQLAWSDDLLVLQVLDDDGVDVRVWDHNAELITAFRQPGWRPGALVGDELWFASWDATGPVAVSLLDGSRRPALAFAADASGVPAVAVRAPAAVDDPLPPAPTLRPAGPVPADPASAAADDSSDSSEATSIQSNEGDDASNPAPIIIAAVLAVLASLFWWHRQRSTASQR